MTEPNPVPPRWRKVVRWSLISLFGGAVVGLVGLNLFLVSAVGRGLIGRKVSAAMHLPVTVGSASYTPWGGARLKDLRVEQGEAAGAIVDDPFFSAASFSAEVQLLSLLGGEVVIDRLVCESPMLSLVRGQQLVQAVTPAVDVTPEPGKVGEPDVAKGEEERKVGSKGRDSKHAAPAPAPAVKKRARSIELREVEVRGGTLVVTSTDGSELVRVDGLKLTIDLSKGGAEKRSGRLSFDRGWLLGLLEVSNFTSPMAMEGRRMNLPELSASCEGGKISGGLQIEPGLQHTRFVAKLSALGIELAPMLEGKFGAVKSGKIGAELALRGDAGSLMTIEGGGRVWLESAVLSPGGEFERLRNALEVDANGNLQLDPAEATFAISRGVLGVREASLGSGRVLLKSVGGVRQDGLMNVATRLYLGADLYSAMRSKPMPGRGAIEFVRLEGTDWFYRDEIVSGNVRDPMVDFWRTGEPVSAWQVVRELSFDFVELGADAIGN